MIRYDGEDFDGMRLSCSAPVFDPVFDVTYDYSNGDRLPGIWITEPVEDGEGHALGRTYSMVYPFESQDLDGADALYYGARYYTEGMGYVDSGDREKRIECFQAAELLYRHAAGKGNPVAYLNLGYVYSYNRCEGRYWRDPMTFEAEEDYRRPYSREERAFECFARAAEADIVEACYKLGDLYKRGMGCDADAGEAFRWYVHASKLAAHEDPVVLGSIALRLASCYEEGFGCEQKFSCALQMYRHAIAALGFAVDNGEAWYEKALASARAGEKRCRQEIAQ